MKRFLKLAALAFALLIASPAFAQSTASQVITGYLTTSGCPTGFTSCFVQYGSSGPSSGTITTPLAVTTTNDSSTVTLGGTFQSAIASSSTRKGCFIENPTTATEPLYVFFGANGSATTANSISLAAGASVNCATQTGAVLTDNVSVTATTSTHAFVAMNQ